MNLQEIRNAVRAQLDVDEEELPNATLDLFLREGFNRTMSVETRWPFHENMWDVSNAGPTPTITLPADAIASSIMALVDIDSGYPLTQIDHSLAESRLSAGVTSARPAYYSVWGQLIYLWPTPQDARNYRLRGYRKPTDWITAGAATTVDADERLHILLIHYAVALAYAQQEDEVLEDVYMRRWSSNLSVIRDAIMKPSHQRPLVLNGGVPPSGSFNNFVWDLPVV